jgi:cation diffusion facilitator CzcD-associated flavoprotein CzcO
MGDNSMPHEMPTGLPGAVPGQRTSVGYEYPESPAALKLDSPYRILDQYHSKPRKLRIASIGAGASGLCLAYKTERMLEAGSWELTLYDKNKHFGGTWWENTYPGVACDVPAHIYTYTFEPNPDWSSFFAGGAEIQKYFENFADKYGLRKYMKLNTKVVEARWNEEEAIWKLKLEDQVTKEVWEDWSHILVNGTGKSLYASVKQTV